MKKKTLAPSIEPRVAHKIQTRMKKKGWRNNNGGENFHFFYSLSLSHSFETDVWARKKSRPRKRKWRIRKLHGRVNSTPDRACSRSLFLSGRNTGNPQTLNQSVNA